VVSGIPTAEGGFPFTASVKTDGTTLSSDFVMNVFRPGPDVLILASVFPVCLGAATTLSTNGDFDSYFWLPGGETTSTIQVNPGAPTVYGVIVGIAGCHQEGSILVETGFGPAPAITAPTSAPPETAGLIASTPATGAAETWSIVNGTISSDPTSPQIQFSSGVAGSVIHLTLAESSASDCASDPVEALIPVDFLDVSPSNIFHDYVDALEKAGVTLGCGAGNFCPDQSLRRDQMAALISRATVSIAPTKGSIGFATYNCSPGGSSRFSDVSPSSPFCASIHYLASQMITLGCDAFGHFCPAGLVTREQMALFIGRAIAPSATPPSAYSDGRTGRSYDCSVASSFTDVPANTASCNAVGYIWARGIVDGFGNGTFGPQIVLTRAPAAKFLANAFGLTLGP
jgi:hypothetical protein